jgi:maleylacetoacetate isomerase
MNSKLILYNNCTSTSSWRVRIAVNLKHLVVEPRFVDLRAGQQNTPEYAELNPRQVVPALVVGDAVIIESLAIIEYLEQVYPEVPLLPSDPLKRAQIRYVFYRDEALSVR